MCVSIVTKVSRVSRSSTKSKFSVSAILRRSIRHLRCHGPRLSSLDRPQSLDARLSHAQTSGIFKRSSLDAVSHVRGDSRTACPGRSGSRRARVAVRTHSEKDGPAPALQTASATLRKRAGRAPDFSMCAESTAFFNVPDVPPPFLSSSAPHTQAAHQATRWVYVRFY